MSRLEERREQIDDLLDRAAKLVQDWDERLTMDNLSIAHRYTCGELRILVQWRIPSLSGEPEDFIAIYERELPICKGQLKTGEGRWITQRNWSERDDYLGLSDTKDDEEVVFVVRVESVETPEGVVPSLVGLQRLQDAYCVLGRSLYLGHARGFKRFFRSADREHCLIPGGSTTRIDKLPGKKVKGGAKVVDGVANDGSKSRRRIFDDLHAIDLVSRPRFLLSEELVRFGWPEEGTDLGVELVEVLLGPFELRPRPEQSLAHALISP